MDVRLLPPTPTTRAARVGLSRRRIADAIATGDIVAIGRGFIVGADRLPQAETAEGHALRVAAALERMKGIAAASHGSAALLHALSRLGRPSGTLRLTRGGGRYRRLAVDARLHVAGLPPEHMTTMYGVLVTTAARTVVDLSRAASFRSGVVVADSALRLGCPPAELDNVLDFCRRWPGRRKAVAVAAFASPLAESPLESVSRVLFHEACLPKPTLQHPITGYSGAAYRVDFYWEDFGVIGEADGLMKYDDPEAGRKEKVREMDLEDAGFEVVRWTWSQIWTSSDLVIAKLRRAFDRQRRRRTA